jgi:exopolysaccharide biosynthesis operon protein EpsL
MPIFAEGIVDIKPYVGASTSYDDNIFRLSQSANTSNSGDTVKSLQLGVDVKLRLSRQLVTLSGNISENKYNQFKVLDNTGKSYALNWSWRLGNDFYGDLTHSKTEAIAGFNEIRSASKNLRSATRDIASLNWDFHPDWTIYGVVEKSKTQNAQNNFSVLDRKDTAYETGLRYQNMRGTQLGLSYRISESNSPNRTGFSQFLFGNESEQKSLGVSAAWLATNKTRISARLSNVKIEYKEKPQRDFNGFSQRWIIDHALTSKLNLSATAYQEVAPIDDIESTYVETTGANINSAWTISSKVTLRAGLGYEQRDYLGSAGFFTAATEDRNDESVLGNLSLQYTPTSKATIQLQYQGEKRTSSIDSQSYQFNNINFLMKYDF